MGEPAHVDVLIVNFATGDLVRKAANTVRGPGVHIWIWDNSGELLDDQEGNCDPVYGNGTNDYYAAANNALGRLCDGEFVLLLNPDVEVTFLGLSRLVHTLRSRPQAWGVAPRLVYPDGSDQNYLHRLPTLSGLIADRIPPLRGLLRRSYGRYICADVDLRREQIVEQPPAACLLVRRSCLSDPILDEQYRLFFNDVDLARRLNSAGSCWYTPSVTASHLQGESFRRIRHLGYSIAREYDRSLLRYSRVHVRGWLLLVPIVALRLLATRALDAARYLQNRASRTE